MLLGLCTLLAGCTDNEKEEEAVKNTVDETLTLAAVEYETRNGMVYGEDISMHIQRDKIVFARYFSVEKMEADEYSDGYETKEDVPITEEQWEKISEAVEAIRPLLEECKPAVFNPASTIFEATDGPNYTNFYLTWENDNGEQSRVQYYSPGDRRFRTLLDLMEETVNPIGREIIYYEAPVMNGIYLEKGDPFTGKKDSYSYQLTPDGNTENEWYFFCYYVEEGETKSYSNKLSDSDWAAFMEKCSHIDFEALEEGKSKTAELTLYYSDNTQKSVKADKETVKKLKEAFEGMMEEE